VFQIAVSDSLGEPSNQSVVHSSEVGVCLFIRKDGLGFGLVQNKKILQDLKLS